VVPLADAGGVLSRFVAVGRLARRPKLATAATAKGFGAAAVGGARAAAAKAAGVARSDPDLNATT